MGSRDPDNPKLFEYCRDAPAAANLPDPYDGWLCQACWYRPPFEEETLRELWVFWRNRVTRRIMEQSSCPRVAIDLVIEFLQYPPSP